MLEVLVEEPSKWLIVSDSLVLVEPSWLVVVSVTTVEVTVFPSPSVVVIVVVVVSVVEPVIGSTTVSVSDSEVEEVPVS